MNTIFAAMLGGWEIVLILAVILVLFGARRIPELAKGLGQGIREFKKAAREVTDEVSSAADSNPPPQKLPPSTSQSQPAQTVSQSNSSKV